MPKTHAERGTSQMTPTDLSLLTTAEAAAYLGLTVRGLRYHIYTAGDLVPDRNVGGKLLFFSKETLDKFQQKRKLRGRPTPPPPPAV